MCSPYFLLVLLYFANGDAAPEPTEMIRLQYKYSYEIDSSFIVHVVVLVLMYRRKLVYLPAFVISLRKFFDDVVSRMGIF